jgi:Ca2+-binding RTX toxin-like protein
VRQRTSQGQFLDQGGFQGRRRRHSETQETTMITLINGTINGETLNGTNGIDHIFGEGGDDTLFGQRGNDQLYGSWGRDFLYGGRGNDVLDGGDDVDHLFGGRGNDKFYDGYDYDVMVGGKGKDTFFFLNDNAEDKANGGQGKDMIDLSVVQHSADNGSDFYLTEAEDGFMALHWTDMWGSEQVDLIKNIELVRDSQGDVYKVSDMMILV